MRNTKRGPAPIFARIGEHVYINVFWDPGKEDGPDSLLLRPLGPSELKLYEEKLRNAELEAHAFISVRPGYGPVDPGDLQ